MTTTAVTESPVNYLNVKHTVASWLFTKDHKRIGLMYMLTVTLAFLVGATFRSEEHTSELQSH